MSPRSLIPLAILGSLVAALMLVCPQSVSAADPTPRVTQIPATNPLDDRYRQIEKMPEQERDRLQRNIAEFQQLTPEQQAHYRDLHQKLAENKAGGGQLATLLSEYTTWLTTLTPSQRDELSNEPDPAKKVTLVNRFKREQDARQESAPSGTPDGHSGDARPFPKRGMFPGPFLSSAELSAVMKVIAADVRMERDKANNESILDFYREVLKTSTRQAGGPREWPERELMSKIEAAIKLTEQREVLRHNSENKRHTVIHLILAGIMNQAFQEVKSQRPSSADLLQLMGTLDQRDRERLTLLPQHMQDFELERRYFVGRKDDPRPRMHEMREQINRLFHELGVRPPGGDGPRQGPGGFGPGGFGSGPFPPRDGMPDGRDGGRDGGGKDGNGRPPRNGGGPDKPRRPIVPE